MVGLDSGEGELIIGVERGEVGGAKEKGGGKRTNHGKGVNGKGKKKGVALKESFRYIKMGTKRALEFVSFFEHVSLSG